MQFGESIPRTSLHLPFPRHDRTSFVELVPGACAACGDCAAACPRRVLGMLAILGHRHVHVDHAAACVGCRRCVASCARGAIRELPARNRRGAGMSGRPPRGGQP